MIDCKCYECVYYQDCECNKSLDTTDLYSCSTCDNKCCTIHADNNSSIICLCCIFKKCKIK